MRTLELLITEELDGRCVKWLMKNKLHIAKSFIARVKLRKDGICLNGVQARTIDIARAGDILSVQIGDSPTTAPPLPCAAKPDIIFEDDDLLILNKSSGMAVHGNIQRGDATVASILGAYLGSERVHLITRLDRGTSGLMVAAKNAYMTERLRRLLHTSDFRREYLAITVGQPEAVSGDITLPIARTENSYKRIVSPDGAPAKTHFETLYSCGDLSLIRLQLFTGRTHQIRLHMSAIGAPLLGDHMYGQASPLISRPALHSEKIHLLHPLSQRVLELSLPLPEDMARLIPQIK